MILTLLRRYYPFAVVALAGIVMGWLLSAYPTVRDDWRFLHDARMAFEAQQRAAQAVQVPAAQTPPKKSP